MKKVTLIVALLLSIATFAQKDEFKILKKVYAKDSPSTSDVEKYKEALKALENISLDEDDQIYFSYFKSIIPMLDIAVLGEKVTPMDITKVLTPENIIDVGNAFNKVLKYEMKTGKQIFTKDINEDISFLSPIIKNIAFDLNDKEKFKESSEMFYALYVFDKKEGKYLENAAILAVQDSDYVNAIKYYEELLDSDYLKNGIVYLATNKASGKEEIISSRETRSNFIKFGTYEKPRDEMVISKKPLFQKTYAILLDRINENEKAKAAYKLAKELNPDDIELLSSEVSFYYKIKDMETYVKLTKELIQKNPNDASLHYNIGYLLLKEDQKIVDEINANLDNLTKYDELIAKRKKVFLEALPNFEEAYRLNPNLENLKDILKLSYEVLEMKEKADKL